MSFSIKKYPTLALASTVQKLRSLSEKKLVKLCDELRQYLLDNISRASGHLASSLGVVELTVALHYVYNTPFDRLIWDVGHQAYPHKILTGRRDYIDTIRHYKGLHPFPYRGESEYDAFGVGHSSTSISAGLGMAVAAKKEGHGRRVVCVIGDGAITAGMAFEAMNHAGDINSDILVILNDNEMSISKNVGALNNQFKMLSNITSIENKKDVNQILINENTKDSKTESNILFKGLGFNYTGPIDGHDVLSLIYVINQIRIMNGPQFLHIKTCKGKGYLPAEINPIAWHSVPKFNLKSGNLCNKKTNLTYSEVFGNWLCEMAAKDPKLVAITPAMCEGSGMVTFSLNYPKRYFDVAIAEQHAVTFAAGLAIEGYRPVVAIYSTFLQRAYDQLIHDVAIQKVPIMFAIDRGGIVGADGQTHQGAFDIAYLRCIPNIVIMTPSDENECRLMLYTGYNYRCGPSSVRYPRGNVIGVKQESLHILPLGKGRIIRYGENIAIFNFGTLLYEANIVANNINATLVDMRFVKPLDENLILDIVSNHESIVTLEEGVIKGGAGSSVNELLMFKRKRILVLNIGLPDEFILHGSQEKIRQNCKLDAKGIQQQIISWVSLKD